MTTFKEISVKDLTENTFTAIGDNWMLITAMDPETGAYNTMTASWGGFGVLFHKPVAYLFIRPQRYTKQFVDSAKHLSLSFFDESYKNALKLCGTTSGRDGDKIQKAGLSPFVDGKIVGFKEADKIFLCRKIYASPLLEKDFLDSKIQAVTYPEKDYHTMYIVEIERVLSK